jgi:hypothetical protein
MTTGSFENFAGTIADIGPLYPFVGSEMLLVIIAVIFWLWWHVSELRIEKREYDLEVEKFANADETERQLDDHSRHG